MPKRIRILYVDKESKNLNAFFMHLRMYKEFKIHLAGSRTEAIEILSVLTVHIIIVNLPMQAKRRMEFLERIAKPKNNPVKIVLTTQVDKTAIEKAKENGLIFYHRRPCNFDELKGIIDDAYHVYCDNKEV